MLNELVAEYFITSMVEGEAGVVLGYVSKETRPSSELVAKNVARL